MANPANGNVFPIGDHPRAKSRLSPRESANELTQCRDLALERIARALSGMLDRVEDELFELAEKASDRDVQNTYLDARSQARAKRSEIEAAFRRHFIEFFNRKVEGPVARTAAAPGELTLLDTEELEQSIAVRDMARRLGSACETELFALSQRMGFLLERPELEDDDNPVSPATVFAALKDACDQIEAGFKVRLALLRQLERHAEVELQGVYQELNAHLVARSILPDVRHGVRRNAPGTRKEKDAPVAEPKAEAAPDLFGTLAQLLGNPVAGTPGGASASQGGSTVPASFLSELTRMHREGAALEVSDPEALLNVVKGIKAAPQSASLGTIDAMTIDIVSMLFDYIFEDRQIPLSVKASLGRLQIPVLKVALLDRNFFSSKSHPARRLIDGLAECAMGVDEANAGGSGVIALVESVVHAVLAEFDTDLELFQAQLARVEAFVAERQRAEDAVVERSARLVEQREREEVARALAEDEVEACLAASPWANAPVRTMLRATWVSALVHARCTEGEASRSWPALVETMKELVWSVEPKAAADDRKRMVAVLPAMLKQLIEGMRRGGLDEPGRSAFLGELVDCHAAAVRSGLRGLAVVPEAPAPVAVPERPSIARELLPVGDIRVQEIRLRSAGKSRNVFTRTGVWTNLQRGTWVEFSGAGGASRARLTWISPNKGVYLFTNPLSCAAAVSISPDALAEQMRVGEARILDDAPLVERAVDSMLASLRDGARPGAPQG